MKCEGTTPSETNEGPIGPVAQKTPITMKDHLDQLDSRIADTERSIDTLRHRVRDLERITGV